MAKRESTVADSTPNTETVTPAAETVAPVAPVAQPFVKPPAQQPVTYAAQFAGDPTTPNNADPAVNGDKGKEGKLLTQADIDAIVKNRLDRALEKYKDYDDLKAKVTDAEKAKLSEDEQRATKLKELETERETLAQERTRLKLENAFLVAATEVGLPAKAALKLADLSKAEYDADGNLTNAKALAEAVVQEFPTLIKRGATPNVVNPGRGQEAPQESDSERRQRLLVTGGGGGFWKSGAVVMPPNVVIGE